MGIRERVEQLGQEEYEKTVEAKKNREDDEKARREKYNGELPQALLDQRPLFNKLKRSGVIELIEEMIYPDKIEPHLTLGEQNAQTTKLAKKLDKSRSQRVKPLVMSREENLNLNSIFRDRQDQEWHAFVHHPEQKEDGAIDRTVRITIDNDTWKRQSTHLKGLKKKVHISFSPNGVLAIKGAEVTYEGSVGKRYQEKIEEGFAKAFHKPETETPHRSPVDHSRIVVGANSY